MYEKSNFDVILETMKKFSLVLLGIVLIVIGFVGCKHEIPPIKKDTVITEEGCDPNIVYFENDVLPLITSSCAYSGCHDAASHKEGVILIDYETIMDHGDVKAGRPDKSELYEVLIEKRSSEKAMPPPPNPEFTTEQKEIIRKWIEQGAVNNRCDDCDSTSVTYSKQVVKVLNANCVGCHNSTTANANVRLDNYTEVKKHVDNNNISGTINHLSGYKAMPPTGTKMSDCNIRTLEIWIKDGALNN
ncbi:MAG: hypothetical protein RLZZ337_1213 [Bacteroidota bacterium]|jgi:uncharacterized membrane protein